MELANSPSLCVSYFVRFQDLLPMKKKGLEISIHKHARGL